MSGNLVVVAVLLAFVFRLINAIEVVDIKCIPLRNCPELLNLLKENPVSQKAIKLLKSSHCGFEQDHPKVWCTEIISNCKSPNGKPGKCIPIKNCQPIIQLIKSTNQLSIDTKNYIQKFQCEDPNSSSHTLSVCCPTDKEPLIATPRPTIPISPTQPTRPTIPIPPTQPTQPTVIRPHYLPRSSAGECGRQLLNRIYGGKVTEMDEFPWTALLEYTYDSESSTACGGSLISKKYVITAAHCADEQVIRRVGTLTNVILGEFDLRNKTDCINSLHIESCADPPVKIPVEEITIHPQWFTKPRSHLNHDIALLRLVRSVTFTDFIHPICLPSPTLTLKEKQRLVVTGWGQTEEGAASFVKLKTTVPIANRQLCVGKYKNDKNLIVGDGELCAGGEEGKDSCSGDSGGPLMLSVDRSGNGVWFLVGVVSFGPNQPCGIKDYPALYTYLPKYIDWIYRTIRP